MKTYYRFEASSIEGFVQQVAVSYVAHGYYFYVTGRIPEGKDPHNVDAKLLAKYGIEMSKFTRARRKHAGRANVQYLRFERFFILLATHGPHEFFQPAEYGGEGDAVRDCREEPIKFASYAISFRGGHASVRIERETYRDLLAYFSEAALRRSQDWLGHALFTLPFEPYAPVRRQLLTILRRVNARRKTAGLGCLESSCLRLRRHIVRPFCEAID